MSETVAEIGSIGSSPHPFRWRRGVGVVALLAAAYAGALVITAPAAVLARVVEIPLAISALTGTVWQGQAAVSGGIGISWQVDPLRSLQAGALAIDWSVTGRDTRLSGHAFGLAGRAEVNNVAGVVGWSVITAAIGDLPVSCDFSSRVDIETAKVGPGVISGRGTLNAPPVTCATDAGEISVPALTATLSPIDGGVRLVAEGREDGVRLGSVDLLAKGWMIATLEPAGARLIPGMPTSAATIIEMPVEIPGALTTPSPPVR